VNSLHVLDELRPELHRLPDGFRLTAEVEHDTYEPNTAAFLLEWLGEPVPEVWSRAMAEPLIRRVLLALDDQRAGLAMHRIGLSATQSRRRKDKPASDPADTGRNDRIRARHAHLEALGEYNYTSVVATEFGISTSSVRRILRGK